MYKNGLSREMRKIEYTNGTINSETASLNLYKISEKFHWERYSSQGIPSVRYGWILLKHNWLIPYDNGYPFNGTVELPKNHVGFELYYNYLTGGMQIILLPHVSIDRNILFDYCHYLSFCTFNFENNSMNVNVEETIEQSPFYIDQWHGTSLPLVYLPNQTIEIELFGIHQINGRKKVLFSFELNKEEYLKLYKHELGALRFESFHKENGNISSVVYNETENRTYYPAEKRNGNITNASTTHKLTINPYYLQFVNISNMKVQSKVWLHRYKWIDYYGMTYEDLMKSMDGKYSWEYIAWREMTLTKRENNTFFYTADYPLDDTTNQEFNMTFFFNVSLSLEWEDGSNSTSQQGGMAIQFVPQFAYKEETVQEDNNNDDENESFFSKHSVINQGIIFLALLAAVGLAVAIYGKRRRSWNSNKEEVKEDGKKEED